MYKDLIFHIKLASVIHALHGYTVLRTDRSYPLISATCFGPIRLGHYHGCVPRVELRQDNVQPELVNKPFMLKGEERATKRSR